MNLPTPIAAQLVPLCASLMLVLQLLLAVHRPLSGSIRLFALQSLMLASIAGIVASAHHAGHLLVVAVLTVAGKVLFLPWMLGRLTRRIHLAQEIEPMLNAPTSMLICGALTIMGYLVARPFSAGGRLGANTLAVAVTLLLTGLFLMINRREALTQVLALLTVENGVMLAAVALTSQGMPLVVEVGVFLDVMAAVLVLGVLVRRIRKSFSTMDIGLLNQLKG